MRIAVGSANGEAKRARALASGYRKVEPKWVKGAQALAPCNTQVPDTLRIQDDRAFLQACRCGAHGHIQQEMLTSISANTERFNADPTQKNRALNADVYSSRAVVVSHGPLQQMHAAPIERQASI